MTRLVWDVLGTHIYETGVDRTVLYPRSNVGVPWSGVTSIKETTDSSDVSIGYVDGQKYHQHHTPGAFSASLEAITFPDLFDDSKEFSLCYRTLVGSDTGLDKGYKIHLVYNARANPVEMDYRSLSSAADANTFTWDISTRPVAIERSKPSAHLIIDTSTAYPATITALEDAIYGTDARPARLPNPQEVIDMFDVNAVFKVTLHEDGSWTAEGPDDMVKVFPDGTFEIDSPSVVYISDEQYTMSSW